MTGRVVGGLLVPLLAISAARGNGEVYGTIHTDSGQVLEGPIRWDRNECFWDDVLDAGKALPPKPKEEEGFKLSLFGFTILDTDSHHSSQGFSIPFGHLAAIVPRGEGARLLLKDGNPIDIESNGSTDLGSSLREVVVEDARKGRVEVSWGELQRVDFRQSPGRGRDAVRLHGTVETAGQSFTGFLAFDANQSLTTDMLEGEEGGVVRRVPLSEVREMRPLGRSSTNAVLASGKSLALRGEGLGRVAVAIDGLGHVVVPWVIVKRVVFSAAPASPSYGTFDGGKQIAGTLRMKDGRELAGAITWDRDETRTFETLDGDRDDVSYYVRFGEIRSIRRQSGSSCEVTLKNGRKLELAGSNDVGDENRGVLVRAADGTESELAWRDADVLELK